MSITIHKRTHQSGTSPTSSLGTSELSMFCRNRRIENCAQWTASRYRTVLVPVRVRTHYSRARVSTSKFQFSEIFIRIELKVSVSNISGQSPQIRKLSKKYGTICSEICNNLYGRRHRKTALNEWRYSQLSLDGASHIYKLLQISLQIVFL